MDGANKKIKVFIAEDSRVVLKMLTSIFESVDDIEVVGSASDGETAINRIKKLRPDIITMDIHMPGMNGLEATKIIMQECPTPIVVISSYIDNEEMNITFNALNEGAMAVLPKPKYFSDNGFISENISLIDTIRALSEVKVVTRRKRRNTQEAIPQPNPSTSNKVEICAIGASTGGPAALNKIFSTIGNDFDFPIVVVQHMSYGFLAGLVSWLDSCSSAHVQIVEEAMPLLAGNIYFAAEDKHLVVYKDHDGNTMGRHLMSDPVSYFRPSVTVLFDSVARNFGSSAMACLLTGMGEDGASGINTLEKNGGLTAVQSEETSVVFGMPKAALNLNSNHLVLDIENISGFIKKASLRG